MNDTQTKTRTPIPPYTPKVIDLLHNSYHDWAVDFSGDRWDIYRTLALAGLFALMTRSFLREGIPANESMSVQSIDMPHRLIRVVKKIDLRVISWEVRSGDAPINEFKLNDAEVEMDVFKFVDSSPVWWNGIYYMLAGYTNQEDSGHEGGLLCYYGPERYSI